MSVDRRATGCQSWVGSGKQPAGTHENVFMEIPRFSDAAGSVPTETRGLCTNTRCAPCLGVGEAGIGVSCKIPTASFPSMPPRMVSHKRTCAHTHTNRNHAGRKHLESEFQPNWLTDHKAIAVQAQWCLPGLAVILWAVQPAVTAQ